MKTLRVFLFGLMAAVIMSWAPANDSEGYQVGDFARDFSLKNVDGSMFSMASMDDAKGYIVIFTCNSCPYAKMYEDRINALDAKYKPMGYPVVAIMPNDPVESPEDSFELMQERAKEKNFSFPYVIDETQEITKTYGATRTPHVYLLKKERDQNKVMYIGAIDDNYRDPDAVKVRYVENAIAAMEANRSIATNFTKAIGCTIKWNKNKS
jgi:peroxiredoxin